MKLTATLTRTELLHYYEQQHHNIAYNRQPAELYHAVKHIMSIKGKRIRPLLLLLVNDMFEGDLNEAVHTALAYEMFHNFTLVHDDIMDNADVRRGIPTVHKIYGQSTAILTGDVMLLYAYRFFEKIEPEHFQPALEIFNKTAIEIMEGQQMDMNFEKLETVSEADYLKMIALKTSVLLAAAAQTGALLADADATEQQLMNQFALHLGLAFQIKDDYLDAFGDAKKVGKRIGGDILQDKKTYLQIVAGQQADDEQKKYLQQARQLSGETKISRTLELFRILNVQQKTQEKMNSFYQDALHYLEQIALSSDRKKSLKDFAEDVFVREF